MENEMKKQKSIESDPIDLDPIDLKKYKPIESDAIDQRGKYD
ncbi:hypothetical protein [Thiomicrorhabdus sp. Kp2]|nr:hypothetical protein [Thiomicrorhabdus sp. Kp2]